MIALWNKEVHATICTLSGTYNNTNDFQLAINSCGTNDTVKLTGTAQWSGNIYLKSGQHLIIANSATVNGSGTITSTYKIIVASGASFTMSATSTAVIGGNSYPGPISATGPSSFPVIALPVKWGYLQAQSRPDGAVLMWSTESERDNRGFDIERSIDNIQYEKIGFVNGHGGTVQTTTEYMYVDHQPLAGVSYYRIKQWDYNDISEYSKAVVVRTTNNDNQPLEVSIYPSLVESLMTIESSEKAQYTIVDMLGRETLSGMATIPSIKLDVTSLKSGIYFIKFKYQNQEVTHKWVKG